MTHRLLVIGGDAAGMSAAATAKRRAGDAVAITVFERSSWTSYSACGIPYWVGGSVTSGEELVTRTPEGHRERGIDVQTGSTVTSLDTANRSIVVRDARGASSVHEYDSLLIATGAEPIRPDLPGIDGNGIHGIQTLDDGAEMLGTLARKPRRAVVVGSGYIGLEMAEACFKRGIETTVVDRGKTPLHMVDAELGELVRAAMTGMGITVMSGTEAVSFDLDEGHWVTGVETTGGHLAADIVVLGLGVHARSRLASDAGLRVGDRDGIEVNDYQRVVGHDDIWAAGDCCLSRDRITGSLLHMPLGTHANKQGLVAGSAIASRATGRRPTLTFPGVVRTAVTKVCDIEIARTGLGDRDARAAGIDVASATVKATTKAGYFPGTEPMTVKMLAERTNRRVVGVQIVGRSGSALRIDTAAMALWSGMTVDDLAMTDLAYAPPFSPVWDPVQVAARALIRELGHRFSDPSD
ncbi:MAG: FAD-dependent oxidoreductase [Aeromicrobium sp.]